MSPVHSMFNLVVERKYSRNSNKRSHVKSLIMNLMISHFIHVSGLLNSLKLRNYKLESTKCHKLLPFVPHLELLTIQERVRDIKVIHAAKIEANNDLDDMKKLSGNRRIGRLFKFAIHVFIQDIFLLCFTAYFRVQNILQNFAIS